MKAIWGLFFSLLLITPALAADKILARLAYEDAEAAFQRNDIDTTLAKLDEAERLLGTDNPPILYLRVQARHARLSNGPFLYDVYQALKKDADQFFRAYGDNESALDMTRDIYKIAQDVDTRQQREQAAMDAELDRAKAGDVAAIKAMIARYTTGVGTAENPATAAHWQGQLAAAELKQDVAAVNDGDIAAMERMAQRYESGAGVKRDPAQADALRTRIQELQAQRAAEEAREQAELAQQQRNAELQRKLAEISYFEYFATMMGGALKGDSNDPGNVSSAMTSVLPASAMGLATDLIAAPTKITQVQALKREATLRAAAWGNPGSVMARALAARQQDGNRQGGVVIPYRIE